MNLDICYERWTQMKKNPIKQNKKKKKSKIKIKLKEINEKCIIIIQFLFCTQYLYNYSMFKHWIFIVYRF